MKHEKTIVFEQELSWRPDLHKAYVDRLSASRIRAAKQCVKLRFFDEQCQMYINETSVLPRYKRQFLNHFLKSCNHFIKTLLTILKQDHPRTRCPRHPHPPCFCFDLIPT